MTKPAINLSALRYFPIQKHWRKLRPFYQSKECESVWREHIKTHMEVRAEGYKIPYEHKELDLPCAYDSCDWRWCREDGRRGPQPAFWDYVCYRACHYLVDMNLYAATRAFPEIPWRIVTQARHSTIWNGDPDLPELYDPQFLALDVPVKEAWEIVIKGRILRPGMPKRHIGPPFWNYREPYQRRSKSHHCIPASGPLRPNCFESGYCSKRR